MFGGKRVAWGLCGVLVLLPVACSGGAAIVGVEQSGQGAVGPQQIEGATEVLKFDPTSIATQGDPVADACRELAAVPGTYQCDLASEVAGPCFALGGTRLICGPNPVTGTYHALVGPTVALPSVAPPSPDRAVPFFVELANGVTCEFRVAPEPVIIGGIPALYECSEPYTYLLGEGGSAFSRDAPTWEAGLYTLDPDTGASPSGKVPVDVARVWIP